MVHSSAENGTDSPIDNADEGARPLIDVIADSFVQRLRRGEHPAVSEYARRYPELADEIEDLFPTLAMLEQCGPETQPAPRSGDPDGVVTDRLGAYRIVREIGRGGMGIVYEAEHDTMRRRVALKTLSPRATENAHHLQRFYREARAAGRMHHTNIVPVFEVGEHGGVHFYAMQFIQGEDLDVVIDELKRLRFASSSSSGSTPETTELPRTGRRDVSESVARGLLDGPVGARDADRDAPPQKAGPRFNTGTVTRAGDASLSTTSTAVLSGGGERSDLASRESYLHRVARVGLQIADALQYAHSQGVLHRDIKPSNLILDTAGVVWITDFGLAKELDDDLTHTGDIVGTLRYMAPERFRGETDERSDIYGLGLTLYELCTLRQAFDQPDRACLVREVTKGAPVPPRKINSQIPRDLETIVLKAIDKHPAHRYQQAADMAEDLRRYLADRPILARRASPLERCWRWCRRNPPQAILTGCVLTLLMLLVVGSLVFGYVMRNQAQRLKANEEAATRMLYDYSVGRAEAGRWSEHPGQHFDSLEALGRAAEILPRLELTPEQTAQERLRLRNQAIAAMTLADVREVRRWPLQGGWTSPVCFNPSHTRYAQADADGNVTIRQVENDGEALSLDAGRARADSMRFAAGGRYLVVRCRKDAATIFRVWDAESGALVREWECCAGAYGLTPQGDRLAYCSVPGETRILDLASGRTIRDLPLGFPPAVLALSPSGEQLAVLKPDRSTIQLWDVQEGQRSGDLRQPGPIQTLTWRPDGKALAFGNHQGTLIVQEVSGSLPRTRVFRGHRARIIALDFTAAGDWLISDSWDGTMRLWNAATGEQLLRVNGVKIVPGGFSAPESKLLSVRQGASFSLWEVARDNPLRVLRSPNRPARRWSVSMDPGGRLLASARDDGVELWDLATGKVVATLPAPYRNDGHSKDAEFLPGGAILTSDTGGLRHWPIESLDASGHDLRVGPPKTLHAPQTSWISIDASGRRIGVRNTVHGGNVGLVMDPADTADPVQLGPHVAMDNVELSPDGRWAVTTTWGGRGIKVWDVDSRKVVVDLDPACPRAKVAFSPDGRQLAVATAEYQLICEAGTWKTLHRFDRQAEDEWPGPVAFSPDGHLLAMAQTRFLLKLVNAKTGEPLGVLDASSTTGYASCCFSPDGTILAAASDENIELWDLRQVRKNLKEMHLEWEDIPDLPPPAQTSQDRPLAIEVRTD